jgi:hypothetical protein
VAKTAKRPRSIRVDSALWAEFDAAASAAGLSRSEIIVAFMAWYTRRPNSRRPQRPSGV